MFHLRFFSVLILLASSTLVLSPAIAQTRDNEIVLRKITERVLTYLSDDIQLKVGELPENLPVGFALPANAQILASIIGNQENILILLDVPESPEEIERSYREQLEAKGWRTLRSNANEYDNYTGFVPSELKPDISLDLCQGDEGPLLSVTAIPVENGPSDVRLSLNSEYGAIACSEQSSVESNPTNSPAEYVEPPLPRLEPSPKSTVNLADDDYYSDYKTSKVIIETPLNLSTLAAHYERQFKQAGWTRLESQPDQSKVVSLWTMKDKEGQSWLGILSFTPVEDQPNQYAATAVVWKF